MNVSGWRAEPEQVTSELTARLLRWMNFTPAPAASIEEAAPAVAAAWLDLLDARALAVWARRTESDDLALLGLVGEGAGQTAASTEGQETPFVAADSSSMPSSPLWLEPAVGAAADFAAQLVRLSGFEAQEPASMAMALKAPMPDGAQQLFGVVLAWMDSPDGMISETMQPVLEAAAVQSGHYLASSARAERLARSLRQLGEAFSSAIDGKDPRRAGHSEAVAYYAGVVARAMDLEPGEVERIEFAALLHDLGRVSVPDAILQKTGGLTPEELDAVRSAPIRGAEWLQTVDGMGEIADIIRHQSERFDGSGAPDGVAGEDIPLGSRIIAVSTRFAAMTMPRADRRPLSVVGGAMEGVVEESGKALDPRVVEAFLRAMGRSL